MNGKTLALFEAKVQRGGDCHLWTAATDRDGYGRFTIRGRTWGAHQAAWILAHGHIPDGMCVLHRCDVRRCVRIKHLFLGTNLENIADRHAKRRDAIGTMQGRSKLDENKVADILQRRSRGECLKSIAAVHGVSQTLIRLVVGGALWRHVERP